jgi:hypothetical protein
VNKPFPKVAWLGSDDRTADELAAEIYENARQAGKQSKQRRVDRWVEFLDTLLNPGDQMRVTEIEIKAREAQLLRPGSMLKDCRPADHAVKALDIEKIPGGPDNGGRAVSWWFRPVEQYGSDGNGQEGDHIQH